MTYMDDLISRAWLKEAIHNFFNGLSYKVTEEDIQVYVEVAPPAFEGMTNGEVLKAVFPNITISTNLKTGIDWWNAPYKGVSE